MRLVVGILWLVSGIAARQDECDRMPLDAVPPIPRQALIDGAADRYGLDGVCRLHDHGTIAYRAHGRGTGITIEVSPSGLPLHREWTGTD